jgi:hypothetical protein
LPPVDAFEPPNNGPDCRLGSAQYQQRSYLMRTSLIAIALLFSLAGPVAAAEQVPFKGSLNGVVTITPINPPVVSVLVEGTGNATHLGSFTLEFTAVVNQATRTGIGPGLMVFTAANGDTLTAESTGSATVVAPGVLSTVDNGTITGGTGRFTGATGSFALERTFFVAAGVTTGSFEGTISSPGA